MILQGQEKVEMENKENRNEQQVVGLSAIILTHVGANTAIESQ